MWLYDLRLILPDEIIDQGSLRIEDGHIAEILEGIPAQTEQTDLHLPGITAIPGVVDLHSDAAEKMFQPRDASRVSADLGLLQWDSYLLGSGITTAYAAFSWHGSRHELAEMMCAVLDELRPQLLVDHFVHARFEIINPPFKPLLIDLIEQDKVQLISFMDHTPGQGASQDLERLVKRRTRQWEDIFGPEYGLEAVEAFLQKQHQITRDWDSVEEIAAMARARNIPMASHDDDNSDKVDRMAKLGITISEFPVSLAAAEQAKSLGMWTAMGAPNAMRGGSHIGNLNAIDGAKAGLVDFLASDYYPAAMLRGAYTLAESGATTLPEAISMITLNPARAVGLGDRGSLAMGKRADIALIAEHTINGVTHPHVCGTLCRGVPVYWNQPLAKRFAVPLSTG